MGAFGNETSTEYLQQANDSLVTVVQIETKDALNNVDAIAKVPGIDVLLIGPFDLGNNIGHPILNGIIKDELKEAIAKIHRAAVENNKRTGIYCTSGKQAREYADQGYHMISVTGDTIVIPEGIASALSAAKGGYMHSALNLAKAGASKLAGSSEN
ncbi:MAG: hypothetical protein M1834_008157 [Cirrosporium novae-zelandiae]|nr:MAG: hypothetical protein M1834_008157 [Cirrosporium novae-zelandiae]